MSSVPIEEPVKLTPITVGWMSLEMAAEYAAVSLNTIRRAADNGELRVARRGGLVRTRPEWVDAWLEMPESEQGYEDDV